MRRRALRRCRGWAVIVGTGCDIIPVDRVRAACERRPALLQRLYSLDERAGADGCTGQRRWERLAGLFAAKEAALKALGTGMRVPFRDVEIGHDAAGRPVVRLGGQARAAAERLGADRLHVSISHSGGLAMATALAEGPGHAGGGA